MVPDTLFGNAITQCMIPVVGDLGALAVGPPTLQQPQGQTGPRNPGVRSSIVVVLDASGSMGDEGKMDEAKASARQVFGQMRGDTEVALIAFFDCGDIRVVQDFTTDPAPLLAALAPIMPSGGTPLGESAGFANEYMKANASSTDRQVTTLTDGQESCSGDLKGTAEQMVNP
jgi:Mg-chelatase subunit ChlD